MPSGRIEIPAKGDCDNLVGPCLQRRADEHEFQQLVTQAALLHLGQDVDGEQLHDAPPGVVQPIDRVGGMAVDRTDLDDALGIDDADNLPGDGDGLLPLGVALDPATERTGGRDAACAASTGFPAP